MPLKTKAHDKAFLRNIERKILKLIKQGTISIGEVKPAALIAYILDIQMISDYNEIELKHSKPEGHRVTLIQNGKALSILDFHYRKTRLYFSISLQGQAADNYLSAIKQLESLFSNDSETTHPVFIEPLLGGCTYLMAYGENKVQLFDNTSGTLTKITHSVFKKSLRQLARGTDLIKSN
jgi:hypothetical protein